MTTRRETWIDLVRFLSIFLIVLYHTPPRLLPADEALNFNMNMGVFFCISGFLFNEQKYGGFSAFFKHRARQILVPYAVFSLLFYVLWLAATRGNEGPWWAPLAQLACGHPELVCRALWYIACLFSIQLMYYWIQRAFPGKKAFVTTLVVAAAYIAAGYLVPAEVDIDIPFWHMGNALVFMPFYAAGHCFKPWWRQLRPGPPRHAAFLAMMWGVAATALLHCQWMSNHHYWGGAYLGLRYAALLMIPAFVALAKWLDARLGRRPAVELVVMSGTFYLAAQNYVIGVARVVLDHAFHPHVMDDHPWLKLVVAIAVMAILYPLAWLLRRYAPWTLGLKKTHPSI